MSKKKRVNPYMVSVQRRVSELGDGFNAKKRLSELRDQMQPLLETWTEHNEDGKKLDAVEHEVRAVGVALRCKGITPDLNTVENIVDEIANCGLQDWLDAELATA